MQFGTPEQDAYRRDFTINSLFYNINEGHVEDFTGQGISDMKLGIIRTPLPPKETFLDGVCIVPIERTAICRVLLERTDIFVYVYTIDACIKSKILNAFERHLNRILFILA